MKLLRRFVENYKQFLISNTTHITKTNQEQSLLDTIKLVGLMGIISIVLAILTKTSENLSYVVYISITILLGSFIIYHVVLFLREKKEKSKNIFLPYVVLKSLPLSVSVLLANVMLLYFYYPLLASVITIISLLVIAIFLYVLYILLNEKVSCYDKKSYMYIIIRAILFYFGYVFLIDVIFIANINISYLVVTFILFTIYFLKNKYLDIPLNDIKYVILILALIGIILSFTANGYENLLGIIKEDKYYYELNFDPHIESDLQEDTSFYNVMDYIVFYNISQSWIYNTSFEVVYTSPTDIQETFIELNDTIYVTSSVRDTELRITCSTYGYLTETWDYVLIGEYCAEYGMHYELFSEDELYDFDYDNLEINVYNFNTDITSSIPFSDFDEGFTVTSIGRVLYYDGTYLQLLDSRYGYFSIDGVTVLSLKGEYIVEREDTDETGEYKHTIYQYDEYLNGIFNEQIVMYGRPEVISEIEGMWIISFTSNYINDYSTSILIEKDDLILHDYIIEDGSLRFIIEDTMYLEIDDQLLTSSVYDPVNYYNNRDFNAMNKMTSLLLTISVFLLLKEDQEFRGEERK